MSESRLRSLLRSPLTSVADPEVDLFAGMKKKKKKQVALELGDSVPAEEQTETAPASASTKETSAETAPPPPAAIETPKTEKVDEPVADAAAPANDAGVDGEGGDLFADMKKKKKKKKEIPLDLVSVQCWDRFKRCAWSRCA